MIQVSPFHCLPFDPQASRAVVVIQKLYITDIVTSQIDDLEFWRAAKDRYHRFRQGVGTVARCQFHFLRTVNNLKSHRRSELRHVDAPPNGPLFSKRYRHHFNSSRARCSNATNRILRSLPAGAKGFGSES